MRVYYESEHGTLYHGDCLEVMDWLSVVETKADMVLCDPPYGTTACKWDAIVPFKPMWKGINCLTRDDSAILMTASQPFTSALIMSNSKFFKYCWVWNKSKAANFPCVKHQPLKIHEDVVCFGGKNHYFPQMIEGKLRKKGGYHVNREAAVMDGAPVKVNDKYYPKSILDFSTANNADSGLHPTQKPVALFEYLIKTYTNLGETVLDFCAGSGTTAIAAQNTCRKWILCEKEEKYCETIVKRLEEHNA